MFKKFVIGSDVILLDVKCGNGVFMKIFELVKEFFKIMILIGKKLGVDVRAEIINMLRLIGREIGNKNEVLEVIKIF